MKNIFLYLASIIFRVISSTRNLLYDYKILQSHSFDIPIVCVGNITVGGNGKTPIVRLLCDYLRNQGYKPVVLLRGYGGRVKTTKVVSKEDTPQDVGDEACLHRSYTNTVISPKRASGVEVILSNSLGDFIIMDDGFQHRALNRDFNIVVQRVDEYSGIKSLTQGKLLPLGVMRECLKSALSRIDAVILNRRSSNKNIELEAKVQSAKEFCSINRLPAFDSFIESYTLHCVKSPFMDLVNPQGFQYSNLFQTYCKLANIAKLKILTFTSIANPQDFIKTVKGEVLNFSTNFEFESLIFKDHYQFTNSDLIELSEKFKGYLILSTPKDIIKIKSLNIPDSLSVFEVRPDYKINDEEKLFKLILDATKKYSNYKR